MNNWIVSFLLDADASSREQYNTTKILEDICGVSSRSTRFDGLKYINGGKSLLLNYEIRCDEDKITYLIERLEDDPRFIMVQRVIFTPYFDRGNPNVSRADVEV